MAKRTYRLCACCGKRIGVFYVISPETLQPEWVCDACEIVYCQERHWYNIPTETYEAMKAQLREELEETEKEGMVTSE